MPVFNFKCECGESTKKLVSLSQKSTQICDNCGATMDCQLPTELSSETLEMRDRHRGVQLPKNQEAKVRKRMKEHEEKYERAEKIDRQGIETADRLGWTKKKKT